MKCLLLSMMLMFSFCMNPVVAQNDDMAVLKSQVRSLADASIEGNTEVLADFTMDELINFMGGRSAFVEFLEESYQEMDESETKILSIEILDEIEIKPFKDEWHCLVPNKTVVKVGDVTMAGESYLFGKSPDKKSWKFIETRELDSIWGEEIFPDFKTDLVIPPSKPLEVVDQ